MKRAESYDEIRPLIEMIKDGWVFEALEWVKAGKPINPPPTPPKCARKRSPLQYAIDFGCHSMVQLLLEGGTEVEQNDRYDALLAAVRCARFDFIKMLVEHGADVRLIDMCEVFWAWEPAIIDYFIEQGADVESVSVRRTTSTGFFAAAAYCSAKGRTGHGTGKNGGRARSAA